MPSLSCRFPISRDFEDGSPRVQAAALPYLTSSVVTSSIGALEQAAALLYSTSSISWPAEGMANEQRLLGRHHAIKPAQARAAGARARGGGFNRRPRPRRLTAWARTRRIFSLGASVKKRRSCTHANAASGLLRFVHVDEQSAASGDAYLIDPTGATAAVAAVRLFTAVDMLTG
jgi:hypothetical protein